MSSSPAARERLLAGAYTYACTWTTSSGRKSCGAVPPGKAPAQVARPG